MSILRLIANDNFIVVNKSLIHLFGLEETLILGELVSEYEYWRNQGKLEDGWFYSTVENIEKNTSLSKHKQKKALENLQQAGVICYQRKGMPAKRYIKINEDVLEGVLLGKKVKNLTSSSQKVSNKKSKSLTSRSEKIRHQEVKEFDRNNNKENNNKNTKKERNKERKNFSQQVESNKKENLDSTQVSDSAINGKKISDSKKSKTFDQLIEEYTSNEELRKELKEHLKTRKLKKAALTDRGVKLSLQKLDDLASNDQEKILIVQNAIMNGWISFYPLKKDEHNRMINSLSRHTPSYDIEAYERSCRNIFDSTMDEESSDNTEKKYKFKSWDGVQ